MLFELDEQLISSFDVPVSCLSLPVAASACSSSSPAPAASLTFSSTRSASSSLSSSSSSSSSPAALPVSSSSSSACCLITPCACSSGKGKRTTASLDPFAAATEQHIQHDNHDIDSMSTAEDRPAAVDQALAAGISLDEFERARANILSMLGKSDSAASTSGASASAVIAAAKLLRQQDTPADNAQPSPSASTSSTQQTSTNDRGSLSKLATSSAASSRKASSQLSRTAAALASSSTDSAPSTATLRTSISSSQTTNDDNVFYSREHTPLTSDDGKMPDASADADPAAADKSDPDGSLQAAASAAAALGMLASSPVKYVERHTRSNGEAGYYAQHRRPQSYADWQSSSPPRQNSTSNLTTSPGQFAPSSPSHSRASTIQPDANGNVKTSTPVRTRLEDIALKSSAQIRRQRERLGLGEEEMMDLDVDARHDALIMKSSLSDSEGDDHDGDAETDVPHSTPMRGAAAALAPGFVYQGSPSARSSASRHGASAHRRGASLGSGMLDRFMETSASPKAAQVAKFGPPLAEREATPEKEWDSSIEDEHSTLVGKTEEEEGDASNLSDEYLPRTAHLTPRTAAQRSKQWTRSPGNTLPSPLLEEVRKLNNKNQPHLTPMRGIDPYPSDFSLASSAKKRKASQDITSSRERRLAMMSEDVDRPQPETAHQYESPSTNRRRGQTSLHSSIGPGASRRTAREPPKPIDLMPPADFDEGHTHSRSPSVTYEQPSGKGSIPASSRGQSVGSEGAPPSSTGKRSKGNKKDKDRPKLAVSTSASSVASGPTSAQPLTAGPSTLHNWTPATVKKGQYDAKAKPPFSYAALIGQAIFSVPSRRLSLADIYNYIMEMYPFYKKQDAGWQNSIRHNLSLNECFVKTARGADEPGKGCLWSILPGTEEQFTGGNFYKKGKVPKSNASAAAAKPPLSASVPASASAQPASAASAGGKRKKANSVVSESMSMASADESFDGASHASSSYAPSHGMQQYRQPIMHPSVPYARQPGHLRHQQQQSHQLQRSRSYNTDPEDEVYDEEDDSFDMDTSYDQHDSYRQPMPPPQVPHHAERHGPGPARLVLRHQRTTSGNDTYSSSHIDDHAYAPQSEEPEVDMKPARWLLSRMQDGQNEDSEGVDQPAQPLSRSARDPMSRPDAFTSPVRRQMPYDHRRILMTSPLAHDTPPTHYIRGGAEPYKPLGKAFSLPQHSDRSMAALLSSPPASGIDADVSMQQSLPPPTPRSAPIDREESGSHIFLPAPNIKPGKGIFGRKGDDDLDSDDRPILPPIHMLSPSTSSITVNTQSPVSSLRASAKRRSISPTSKHESQSSVSTNGSKSPTLSKSKNLSDVFKTPDRFGVSSTRAIPSPGKLAHLASTNASKALQSLQQTPRLASSRTPGTQIQQTPGGSYDPYEYRADLEEEFSRLEARRDGKTHPSPFGAQTPKYPDWDAW